MNGLNQVSFMTDADQDHVVRAFRHAFFDYPTLADHFKPTPLGHFRSMLRWEAHEIIGCAVGAKLVQVNLNRTLEDWKHFRSEIGETVGLDCEPDSSGLAIRPLTRSRLEAQPRRSSCATHSTCGVWGNMSTGRTLVNV